MVKMTLRRKHKVSWIFQKTTAFPYYLHFFQDFVESFKELSLIFQRNDLLTCEIPRLVDEQIPSLEMLSVISDGDEIVYDYDVCMYFIILFR